MSRLPASIHFGLARLTTGLLSLLLLAVLTRVLSAEELGRYAVLLSVASFAVVAGFQGLTVAVVRLGPVAGDRSAFLAALRRAAGRRLPLAVAAALLAGWWAGVPLGIVALVLVAGQGWYELMAAVAVAESAPGRYWALAAGRGLLCVAGAGLFGTFWGAPGAAAGIALGFLAAGVVAGWPALRSAAGQRAAAERNDLERLALPLAGAAVLNTAVASGDRLLLAAIAGVGATGYYAPTYDLAQQAIWALMMVANQTFYPAAVLAFERSEPPGLRGVLSGHLAVLVGLGLPAAVGLALLAPAIGRVVLGAGHSEAAARLLPVLAAGLLLGGIKAYYADVAHQLGRRPGLALMSAAVAAGGNLALNLWLIPRHGALGAAYATLGAYALGLAASWTMARAHLPLRLPAGEVGKTTLASAAMAGVLWLTESWSGGVGLTARIAVGLAAYLAFARLLGSAGIAAVTSRRTADGAR